MGGGTYKKMLGVLSELGYDVEWEIYNSKSFSVPQNRERLYIKGYFRAKCGGEILSQKRDCIKTPNTVNSTKIEKVGNLSNTNHGGKNVYSKDGLSPTLCSESIPKNGVNIVENTLKPVHFERQVQKRVHTVDYDELSDFLRSHKKAANATLKDISEKLGVSKSEVDHWFRKDKFFAPPPKDVWDGLKNMLDITDDRYDAFITEFEWVDGIYEMDKRAYESDGISPTLNTKGDGLIKVVGNFNPTKKCQSGMVYSTDGICRTLTATDSSHPVHIMDEEPLEIKVAGNLSATGHHGENVVRVDGISSTLTRTNYKHPIKILENDKTLKFRTNTKKGYDEVTTGDGVRLCHPSSTKARGRTQKGQTGALSTQADRGTVDRDYRIRKLTPVECERLQAFPDGWTEYGANGEKISDTQRYKCLGNAVTTTVVTYIANHMFGG